MADLANVAQVAVLGISVQRNDAGAVGAVYFDRRYVCAMRYGGMLRHLMGVAALKLPVSGATTQPSVPECCWHRSLMLYAD